MDSSPPAVGTADGQPRRVFREDLFTRRTIFITGASSGLGRATAICLARHGARTVIVGRNRERLEEAAGQMPVEPMILSADLADDEAAAICLKQASDGCGPIDGIFHAAGIGLVAPTRLTKRRQIDEVFGSAVFGAFGIARAACRKGVLADGSSVLFMSSIMGKRGRQGLATYSAAKAAVAGLARSLAMELAPRRIRVNSLAAGAVETEMHQQVSDNLSPSMMASYEALHPLGFGRSDDVVNAAMFLLSDGARWITGTDLSVDGGYAGK